MKFHVFIRNYSFYVVIFANHTLQGYASVSFKTNSHLNIIFLKLKSPSRVCSICLKCFLLISGTKWDSVQMAPTVVTGMQSYQGLHRQLKKYSKRFNKCSLTTMAPNPASSPTKTLILTITLAILIITITVIAQISQMETNSNQHRALKMLLLWASNNKQRIKQISRQRCSRVLRMESPAHQSELHHHFPKVLLGVCGVSRPC